MNFKCVFRDCLGFVRIVDFEADSLEAATVGLHDRCRDEIDAIESVDKSTLMVWLEFLIDPEGDHFRIYYAEEENTDAPSLQQVTGDKGIVINEPVFEAQPEVVTEDVQ